MTWVQILVFLWMLPPGSAVYVKGHSRAADKARADVENLTCYSSALTPEMSTATLQVDRIFNPYSRRSWVILVMTDSQRKVIYEKKAEENPWPLPPTIDRLLRDLAKSTCSQHRSLHTSLPEQRRDATGHPQADGKTLMSAASK